MESSDALRAVHVAVNDAENAVTAGSDVHTVLHELRGKLEDIVSMAMSENSTVDMYQTLDPNQQPVALLEMDIGNLVIGDDGKPIFHFKAQEHIDNAKKCIQRINQNIHDGACVIGARDDLRPVEELDDETFDDLAHVVRVRTMGAMRMHRLMQLPKL